MKRKCSEYNEPVKKKIKCRCCLKRIPDITEAYELTDKINRQFYKLTNLKLKVKSSRLICVACKKELKYITNLRTSIISRSLSCILNNSEEVSSFKTSLSISKSQKKKYREHCRICFANDIELRSSSYVISYQFEKLTELELAKNDKQCLLCINEFQYLERVRKDLLKSHDVFYKNQVKNNICCYYCTKPFKKEREMVDITDKMKSQFKDFTGIDISYDEEIIKICRCCEKKLIFVTHLKATLISNQSDDSDDNCQCCSKKYDNDQKRILATEKIESQFYKITNKKLLKYSSICNVCKLKLDYVVVLQSNLMKNHTPLETKENTIVKMEKKKKIVKIIDDSLVLNQKRRKINLKSIEEEPIIEKLETDFNCLHCDKGFNKYEELNVHVNFAHNDLNAVKCRKCEKWYKIKLIDVNKGISISKEKIKKYVCDHCVNNSYKTAGLCKTTLPTKVKIDKTTKVKSIRVHKCEICGFVVKTAPNLVAHMLSLHSNDRPFSCTQCSSAFNTISNLNKHVRRVHDQLRNAKCPLCIKTFFSNDGVKLHIQQFHNDDKNYKCKDYDDCEKGFKTKYKLDDHIRRVHLLERNYPCPICGLAYFNMADLRGHSKSRHEKF